MSLADRLEAAICADSPPEIREAQYELVRALLRREHGHGARGERATGQASPCETPVLPAEECCPNCHITVDETGYCDMCGKQLREATVPVAREGGTA